MGWSCERKDQREKSLYIILQAWSARRRKKQWTTLNGVWRMEFNSQGFTLCKLLVFITSLTLKNSICTITEFINHSHCMDFIPCIGSCNRNCKDLRVLNQLCVLRRTLALPCISRSLWHHKDVEVEIIGGFFSQLDKRLEDMKAEAHNIKSWATCDMAKSRSLHCFIGE